MSPDVIRVAASSRSTCRLCTKAISQGELRFGRSYKAAHGEAYHWFHLRCAAESQPDKLRATLMRFPAEIPGLETVLEGTDVIAVVPPPRFVNGSTLRTSDEAIAGWRASDDEKLSPEKQAERLLATLRDPLPAPRAWRERYKAWRSALSSGEPVLLACVLRSLNPYRESLASAGEGLSYSERQLFEEARARLATHLAAALAREVDSVLSAIKDSLDSGLSNENP